MFETVLSFLEKHTLLLSLTLILFLFLYYIRVPYAPGIPAPPALPIIGHTLYFVKHQERWHDWVQQAHQKFQRSFQMSIPGNLQVYAPLDPVVMEHFLSKRMDNYLIAGLRVDVLGELLGQGIFSSNGSAWKVHRKAASHMFTVNRMKQQMATVIVEHAKVFLEKLEQVQAGQAIDLQDWFFRYTLDTFSEIAFGVKLGCLTKDTVPFANAFDKCQLLMMNRFFDIFYRWKRRLQVGYEREITEQVKIVNSFVNEMIETRKQEQTQHAADGEATDLISLFLDFAKTSDHKMSENEIRDLVVNFLLAGRDTTACALAWSYYNLCRNPRIEQKLWAELDGKSVVVASASSSSSSDEKFDGDFSSGYDVYAKARDLPYTEAVLMETLRLHPSVPNDTRVAVKEDVWPDGTRIPAGTDVQYSPYAMGRAVHLWGEDAEVFKPERWIGAPAPSQYKFITFNAGPRLCLGKSLAIFEAKTLISMISSNYRFRLVDTEKPPEYVLSVTMPIKNGLKVYVEKRN